MKMKTRMAVVLASVFACIPPALAETREPSLQTFEQADTNSDGRVTLDELKTALPGMTPERFKQLDRNGDGVLTTADRETTKTAPQGQMREKLQQADANHDRQITLEEAKAVFPRATERRFQQMDQDGDGVISRADFKKAGDKLKQADKDGDSKVSLEEAKAVFPRMTAAWFKKFDRNGDGFLSREDRGY